MLLINLDVKNKMDPQVQLIINKNLYEKCIITNNAVANLYRETKDKTIH